MPRTAAGRKSPILVGRNPSSPFNRITAKGIDLLLVTACFLLLRSIWGPIGPIAAAILVGIQDAFGEGQSVGKRIIGLRVLDDASGLSCNLTHSLMRNLPLVLSVGLLAVPVLWAFALFVTVPFLCLELYLVCTLETGVRAGDVMGNTLVVEFHEDRLGTIKAEDNT